MISTKKNHPLVYELSVVLLFGLITGLLSHIKFTIPEITTTESNLGELGLLVSVLYVSRFPSIFGVIILSFVIWWMPFDTPFTWNMLIPRLAVLLFWFSFREIHKKLNLNRVQLTLRSTFSVIFYYFILILLISLTIEGLSLRDFPSVIVSLFSSLRIEIAATSLSFTLFVLLDNSNKQLAHHLESVEKTVLARTQDLRTTVLKLKETQGQLIQSERLSTLGTVAVSVSHLLNNSLNYVGGNISLLQRNLIMMKKECDQQISSSTMAKETFEDLSTMMSDITIGVDNSVQVVESLKAVTSHEKGKIAFVDLAKAINQISTLLSYELESKNLLLELDTEGNSKVFCYPDELIHAILNLMINSTEASPNEQKISITLKSQKTGFSLSVANLLETPLACEVSDLTKPFFSTKKGHSGLGLSLVQNVVEMHLGEMSFEASKQTFTVTITVPLLSDL